MKNNKYLALILVVVVTTLTMGYAKPAPAEKWVVGASANPCMVVDPGVAYQAIQTHLSHQHIFEPLTAYESVLKPDGTVGFLHTPVLATGYKFVDPTHIRFKLRKGVKFQDGQDFSAEDVKYSFDYYKKMPLGGRYRWASLTKLLKEVKVLDPYTVEFVLEKPNIDTMNAINIILIMPKSRGFTKESVQSFQKNPVGTGPYKVKKFVIDQYFELEAWDGYREGVARPKHLTIKYVPEPSSRLAGLETGELDIIDSPATEHLARIEANPKAEIFTFKGGNAIYYLFQYYKPPFDNVKVRQAINYAVDKKAIVDKILEGRAIVTSLPENYGGWLGVVPELKPYPYDPQKAKKFLAEAGYPNGFDMKLMSSNGETLKDAEIAQAIQAYLADVGIKATLQPTELGKRYELYYQGGFEMQTCEWGLASYSPWRTIQWDVLFYPTLIKKYGGAMPEDIAQIKVLFDKLQVMDRSKATDTIKQINRLRHDLAVNLPLYALDDMKAYNKAKMGQWEVVSHEMLWYAHYYDYRSMYPANRKITWEKF
jgi:peptide/nickel transport system substrate-binding protein